MAFLVLDLLPDETDQRQRVTLDGTTYGLRFRWNDRSGTWLQDVLDDDGAAITSGMAVRVGPPSYGLPFRTRQGMPPGVFLAVDTTGMSQDPGVSDLGVRVRVYYADLAEVTEAAYGPAS